jgi:hypothetical protein
LNGLYRPGNQYIDLEFDKFSQDARKPLALAFGIAKLKMNALARRDT